MSVTVVCRPFLAVFQHVVSFVDFLEFGFGFLVARVAVRMIFHRQTPVRLLNGFAVGVTGNFQQFVIVFSVISSAYNSLLQNRFYPYLVF